MNVQQLRQIDLAQIFRDWGEPAQLVEVQQQYDPACGSLQETRYAGDLCVIRAAEEPIATGQATATLNLQRRQLLVRVEDVPGDFVWGAARILLDETSYEIRSVRESPLRGVLLVDCVAGELPVNG